MGVKKINSKRVLFDNILFSSSLEAYCYKELSKTNLIFRYESESFIISDKERCLFKFWKKTPTKGYHESKNNNLSAIKHTPDFIIYNERGEITSIIETKGFSNDKFKLYRKLFFQFANKELKYLNAYYLPSNQKEVNLSIATILKK